MRRTLRFAGLLTLLLVSPLQAQQVTLNLKEVDIETLIQMVSEVTKRNFVVDARVKGKVTVISATPMSEEDLYSTFLSILSVHGYSAVPSGRVVKIVPEALAKSDGTAVGDATGGDEIVTQTIEVKHVNAAQLIPILRPLVPQEGHIAASPNSNILIISDRAANVARMREIIQRVDKAEQNDIEVMVLKHATATEIVRILNSLAQQAQTNPQAQTGRTSNLVADERTNSVLISGEASERLRLRTLVSHLDTPLAVQGNTQVVYLHYAQAKELAEVLRGVSDSMNGLNRNPTTSTITPAALPGATPSLASPASATAGITVATNIQADPSTNSLIITATPSVLQALQSVIRQLDVRRAQVLVEAIIAEIESTKLQELGVQWMIEGLSGNIGPIGLVNFGSPGNGIVDVASSLYNNSAPASTALNGINLGAGRYQDGGGLNFAVLLRALASDSNANVLSTPSLLTLDNQEAQIHVGQNVPFVTGQYTNTGSNTGATSPFQTIQRQDVGIKLKVTPQINEGNTIKLDIEQEVSSVVADKVSTADIVTNTRSLKTSVMIDDGNIVVLGGLIDETLTDSSQKVPGLGDLPLIGALFRSQGVKKVKRNLMIFLHPRIIRDASSESQISHGKYNYMRDRQLEHQALGVPFTEKVDIPVLPNLNAFLPDLPPAPLPSATPTPAP